MKISALYRLMRLHKPVGIVLLWSPIAWSLWIASDGLPRISIVLIFSLGVILMRSAGCVINDIADRHIDLHVKRTSMRPLLTGEVSLLAAFILFICLLLAASLLIIQLTKVCFYYAILAVLITIVYPFCKRSIKAPQLVLGIAFSLGIPMVFASVSTGINPVMAYLLILNFTWVICYDTQYAMADMACDLNIGVKSTAILFGRNARLIIGLMQIFFHCLWLLLAYLLNYSLFFFAGWGVAAGILLYQQKLLNYPTPNNCLRAFNSNYLYGIIMWVTIVIISSLDLQSNVIHEAMKSISNIDKISTNVSSVLLPAPYNYLLLQPLMTKGIEEYYQRTPYIQTLYAIRNQHNNTYYRVITMLIDNFKTKNNVKLTRIKKEATVVELAFITINFNELPNKIIEEVLNTNIPFGKLLSDNHVEISTTDRSYFMVKCDKAFSLLTGCNLNSNLYGRTNTIIRADNHKWIANVVEILPGFLKFGD